jgi:chemotaxis protein methyltransferase CheR
LRALAASDGSAVAERETAREAARYPLDPELHYLRGMLLLDLGRTNDALAAIRRVLYLDRTLAVAHYALGAICERAGDHAGAVRAYRNAARLAAAQPAEEIAPLSDGEPHRAIAIAARSREERLARVAGEDAR